MIFAENTKFNRITLVPECIHFDNRPRLVGAANRACVFSRENPAHQLIYSIYRINLLIQTATFFHSIEIDTMTSDLSTVKLVSLVIEQYL